MNRIRLYRERSGLTQAKLAEMAGISQPLLSRLERGITAARHEHMVAIAQALGQPISNLTSDDSEGSRLFRAAGDIPAEHRDAAADMLEAFLAAVSRPGPKGK